MKRNRHAARVERPIGAIIRLPRNAVQSVAPPSLPVQMVSVRASLVSTVLFDVAFVPLVPVMLVERGSLSSASSDVRTSKR